MKILYLSQSYVPSRRADSVQVMRMCAAFAGLGHDVELVTKLCPDRQEPASHNDHGFYGVPPSFRITKLHRPARKGGGLLYSAAMAAHLRRRRRAVDLVFSRDLFGAWLACRLHLPVRFEAHGVPRGALAGRLFRSCCRASSFQGLVVITHALFRDLRQQALYAGNEAIVAPDAADLHLTPDLEATDQPPIQVRPRRFHFGYVGHLYSGRGIKLIVALAERAPDCDFHVVGGHSEAVESWRRRNKLTNLFFHGFLQPSEVARVYPLFDALLMPHQSKVGVQSGRSDIARWTSPMKLFEYMAAGKPIIASDLPVLREVLAHGHNALLAPPEDLEAWLAAVRRLQEDERLRRRLGHTARSEQAALYTWDRRAAAVLTNLADGPTDLCVLRPTMGQGGADRVTATLLRCLDRRRFRPRLTLMRAEGALLEQVPADVPIHELSGRSLWTAWWPLARLLRRTAPDVLLSTSGGANLVAVLGRRLCGRPMRLVLSERNMLYRDQGRLKRWLQVRLKRWLYPSADCVTAVSEGVRRDLATRLRLPPDRIRVISNPIVSAELGRLAAAAVAHPWFAEETPVVLAAGRLVPAKGFDALLDAFADLRARRPARLVVLGEGPQRRALNRRASELGVADGVWLAGFDPNPFRYMARCSVFVLSSRYEGLPGALIQAMACGAAVVATDCPSGPAEIVEDGVTGLLVPVDDRQAIGATIERLLDEPELAARLGRAARGAVGRFATEAAVEAYAEALTGGPTRAATDS